MELVLDGKNWTTPDNVYHAFFEAVGAPIWHGHNLNALRDSICVGRINKIDLPYSIRIKNYALIGTAAKKMAADFVQLVKELKESGCPVEITLEN